MRRGVLPIPPGIDTASLKHRGHRLAIKGGFLYPVEALAEK